MEDRTIELEIASRVARYTGRPATKITPNVRLWHDLKIAGDDFSELIEELHLALGVTLAGQFEDYCPNEGDAIWEHWSPFKRAASYRELPVSALIRSAKLKVMVG